MSYTITLPPASGTNPGSITYTFAQAQFPKLVVDFSVSRGNSYPIYNFPFKKQDILYISRIDGNLYEFPYLPQAHILPTDMFSTFEIPNDGYYSIISTEDQVEIQQIAHFNNTPGPLSYAILSRLIIPEIKFERKDLCYHEYKEYIGLTQKYNYCTKCDHKKYE